MLKGAEFDVLVTDEASQVLTPALLLGSARVKWVVLAGDHKQLPPTIMSPSAAQNGLAQTAFERAIAPYSGQVAVLTEKLSDVVAQDLEIDSVDGFQGREKEVILVSLVRSNGLNEIGFVADVRRLNVAITRAKRKLILIGDSATLSNAEIFRDYYDAAMKSDSYRSVFELGLDLF